MKRMAIIAAVAGVAALAAPSPSQAFIGSVTSDGEAASVQSGFYECKQKGKGFNTRFGKVNEETLLVLVNEHPAERLCACIMLLDGNETPVAAGITDLSPLDLDTINLCQVLTGPTGLVAQPAGVIEVVTFTVPPGTTCSKGTINQSGTPQGGAYGWVKNVTFKGNPLKKRDPADPFTAVVVGVGKTPLRITPKGVSDGSAVGSLCLSNPALQDPLPSTVYTDNTFE